MNMPFTVEQFLGIFATYNSTIWPMQFILNLLALVALVFAVKPTSFSNKLNSGILAFLWLWTGIVYHLTFFTAINKAAYVFGIFCVAQGLIFLYGGVYRPNLSFHFQPNLQGILGGLFILYGLVIYPTLGYFLGHIYPTSPTFGAPCPTTIFTFGLLLWTDKALPKYVIGIPLLWSLIGFMAALSFTITEDYGLLIAGLLGTLVILLRRTPQVAVSQPTL